jgi:hypothetical protein
MVMLGTIMGKGAAVTNIFWSFYVTFLCVIPSTLLIHDSSALNADTYHHFNVKIKLIQRHNLEIVLKLGLLG